jgi:EAL domain-containing protein (putative c-di-GMP-specific phosphodiesterase class I)
MRGSSATDATGSERLTVRPDRLIAAGDLASDAAERRRLEHDLRQSLAQDGFELHYQPRIGLGAGVAVGAEALLRWRRRFHASAPPALLLPLVERSGLATHLGGWVLRRASAEAASWPGNAIVSVNIFPHHLAGGAVLDDVAAALDASGLPPERLELEFSERALLDPGFEVPLILAALLDIGVGIALDGFGAGHASLAVPLRLPLSAIKLDRLLIRSVPYAAEDAAIVRALIELAHALGLKVVAMGLESPAQRSFLAGAGCDEAQGCLVSEAMALEPFRAYLAGQ